MVIDGNGTKVADFEVKCTNCGINRAIIRDVAYGGLSEGQRWDIVIPRLIALKWAIRPIAGLREGKNIVGNRRVLCPACWNVEQRELNFEHVLPHDPKRACPKCGGKKVSIQYDTGRHPASLVTCEHLCRTCQRCGYHWPEKTL